MTKNDVMSLRSGALLAGAWALVSIAGCASNNADSQLASEPVPRAFLEAQDWRTGDRPVTQPIVLRGARAQGGRAELVARQRMEAAWDVAPGEGGVGGGVGEVMDVRFATNSANAAEVIRTFCEVYLERSYVLDPTIGNASQTVTLNVDEQMTRQDIRDLLGGLAAVYGWMIEDRGGVLYFRAKGASGSNQGSAMARSDSAPILTAMAAFESDQPALRIKRLRHLSSTDVTNAVKDLVSQGGSLVASGRTLLIVDTVRQTNRLSRVIDALDVPAFEGVEIHTYRLAHRSVTSAVGLLESLSQSTGLSGASSRVAYVELTGTCEMMVIARDPTALTMVRDLIDLVDRPSEQSEIGSWTYRIQHYDPQELVRMVRDFFGARIEAPSVGPVQPPTGSGPVDGGAPMRLVLDAAEDLLLVRATPEDYTDLLAVIRTIDRPRQQVMLNSIIAEVTLENRLEFGVDYFLNALEDDGTVIDLFGTPGLIADPTGTLTLIGASGQVVIQALRSEADVDILSQPRLVVRDRVRAEFQVGGSVPIITGDVNSDTTVDGSTAIRRDIEYRDTGVLLNITPRINESGMVTLEIEQEINEVGTTSDLGPEFTTRELRTEVTVPHGQTVLLAGIIESTTRTSERGIPVLGELPIAGAAFRTTTDEVMRRELMLAITPTIIASPEQAQGTLGDFLEAAHGMRAALDANEERLQRGVLNADALDTRLGGFGAEVIIETPEVRPDESFEERRTYEGLREPASDERATEPEASVDILGLPIWWAGKGGDG